MYKVIIKNLEYGILGEIIGFEGEGLLIKTMHGEVIEMDKSEVLAIPRELTTGEIQIVHNNLTEGLHPLLGIC